MKEQELVDRLARSFKHRMANDLHETLEYITMMTIKVTCIACMRASEIETVVEKAHPDLQDGIEKILNRHQNDFDIDKMLRDVVLMTRDTIQHHLDL